MLIRSLTAVAIASALMLSACGKGANPSQTSAGPAGATSSALAATSAASSAVAEEEDCSYISPAQLSKIEGATYAAPTAFHSICTWTGSDGNPLSITLTRNATEADWQEVLSTVQRDQATDAPVPIPGLGDRAAGTGQEIAVQHGSVIIDIRDGDTPGYGKWPKSTAIANTVIAALH